MPWEGAVGLMAEIIEDLSEVLDRRPVLRQKVYEVLIRNFEAQDAEGLVELALDYVDPRFSQAYWKVHPDAKDLEPGRHEASG